MTVICITQYIQLFTELHIIGLVWFVVREQISLSAVCGTTSQQETDLLHNAYVFSMAHYDCHSHRRLTRGVLFNSIV